MKRPAMESESELRRKVLTQQLATAKVMRDFYCFYCYIFGFLHSHFE